MTRTQELFPEVTFEQVEDMQQAAANYVESVKSNPDNFVPYVGLIERLLSLSDEEMLAEQDSLQNAEDEALRFISKMTRERLQEIYDAISGEVIEG